MGVTKTIRILLAVILAWLFFGCATMTPNSHKYLGELNIPVVDSGLRIKNSIPTQLIVKTPLISSSKIQITSQNGKYLLYYIELEEDSNQKKIQKAITDAVKKSELYQTITDLDTGTNGHSLVTKIYINNIDIEGATAGSRKQCKVEVEYAIVSKQGEILSNGSIKELGASDDGSFTFSVQQEIGFMLLPLQEALSKATSRIPIELSKNSHFIQLARADAIQGQSYSYNSTHISYIQHP